MTKWDLFHECKFGLAFEKSINVIEYFPSKGNNKTKMSSLIISI